MKPRLRILLLLLPVLVGVVVGVVAGVRLARTPPEPAYQGKPLSQWIAETKTGGTNQLFRIIPSSSQRDAFKAMGLEALPALLESIRPDGYEPWWSAAYRCGYSNLPVVLGRHLPLPAPYDSETETRFQSYVTKRCQELLPQSEPWLIQALGHSRPEVRATAAWALRYPAHSSPGAFAALTNRLRDGNPEVRRCVLEAVSYYGPAASNAVPAIVEIIRHGTFANKLSIWDDEETAAFRALERIGPGALAAVNLLKEGVGQKTNSYLRVCSAVAIWHVREQPLDALPALVQELGASNRRVRQIALHYLGQMGAGAAPAVPAVVAYLDSLPIAYASDAIPEWHEVIAVLRKIDPSAAENWEHKAGGKKP